MKKTVLRKTLLIIAIFSYGFNNVNAQNWNEIIKNGASDRALGDEFGYSVSISGDYAIVGAPEEDENASGMNFIDNAGSAYVFERDGSGNWNEVQKIVASDRDSGNEFGWSVSISGDYAIVGAFGQSLDASGLNYAFAAGSVYVFERDGSGNWNEVQKIVASDRASDDFFGFAVSISGDYAIVGAHREDHDASEINFAFNTGSAYVFERDGSGNWNEVQKIIASDRASNDEFGISVSISGDYAIVGAWHEDEDASGMNTAVVAGSAYMFERANSGNWNEVQKIVPSDRDSGDLFGVSVSVSGDYAIVGAYFEDEDALGESIALEAGSAYVIERDGSGNWNEVQKIVASDRDFYDLFGFSVSISGDYAIVGAYQEDASGVNNAFNTGSAYVFERSASGNWNEVQKIAASDHAIDDEFGRAVSISGAYAIVGAWHEDEDASGMNTAGNAGSVYVFEYDPTTGISEQSDNLEIAIFPNPVNSQLRIDSKEKMETIMIMDITGKTIKTFVPSSNTINVSDLVIGIYLLQIQTNKGLASKKFIKE